MELMENVVQPYAWGSHDALAQLQGRPRSEKPEAELWMGAHVVAPSKTPRGRLDELIAQGPERELGAAVVKRFGPKLPFLLKLIAAGQPLSLQSHPNAAQAKEGFAREEAAKVPLDAPQRSYKDPNHKPELLCALTPFHVLCGFRPLDTTVAVVEALGKTSLDSVFAPVFTEELESCFRNVMKARATWPVERQRASVAELKVTAAKLEGSFPAEAQWTRRIAELYPDDLAVAATLLLNAHELKPGEGVFLPDGNLHAYLSGFGVEVMAASDNVLRGGLTPKHVDVPELLKVLKFDAAPIQVLTAAGEPEGVYRTPAPEFRLSLVQVKGAVTPARRGPEILVCTAGAVSAGGVALKPGASAWCPASDGPYTLEGQGEVYRATVGD